MRFLITGAQGFIGRYLTAEIFDRYSDAAVLGIGRSPRLEGYFSHEITHERQRVRAPLPPRLRAAHQAPEFSYRRLALSDTEALSQVIEHFRPDAVVHLACALARSPLGDLLTANVLGTASLMKAIENSVAPRPVLVLGSSGAVYGPLGPNQLPVAETTPCFPEDLYAISKYCGENLARLRAEAIGIPIVIARIFNVAGPGQNEHHLCGRLAALATAAAADGSGGAIRTGDLTTARDYIDVRDVASALLVLAESKVRGVVNVASGIETTGISILEVFLRKVRLEDRAVEQQADATIPAGLRRHSACTKQLRALGFAPRFCLQQTLEDIWRYYMELPGTAMATAM
jgi:nucleoside-diphosphate-sugar epimerase